MSEPDRQSLNENIELDIRELKKSVELISKSVFELQNRITKLNETQSLIFKKIESETSSATDLLPQFHKLDQNLGRYFKKFSKDNQSITERLDIIENRLISMEGMKKTQTIKERHPKPRQKPIKTASKRQVVAKQEPTFDLNKDIEVINQLKKYLESDYVYSTEAIKKIEDMRDNLLFDRDFEAPYRGIAAKIFREIVAIAKQEKDFSTLSHSAISDILSRIDYLISKISN